MNKKISLLAAVALCAPLFACGGTPASETPASSTPTSSRPTSSTPASQTPTSSKSLEPVVTENYYALPFNEYVGSTRSGYTEYKWDKGFTYKWEFNIPQAFDVVTLAIGVKMSNSNHGDRTLFTNSSGADSSDTFESNSANDGTPRLSVKANNTAYDLTNRDTYSANGLDTSRVNYLRLTSFPVVAGKNTIEVTTHAQTGYRLMVGGGDVRLYYAGDEVPQSVEPFVPGDGVFSDITEFANPIDMHTADQKAFLEYTGAYEDLTAAQLRERFHVSSTQPNETSDPTPVHIEWTQAPKAENYHYEVEVSQDATFPADKTMVYDVGNKKSVNLYNQLLGATYNYRIKAVYGEGEPDVSAVKTFSVLDNGLRNLRIDGLTNVRDLGGKTLENGSRFKQGMIFRTSALNSRASDATTVITAAGKNVMLNELGVKSEIELRGGSSGTGGEGASASSTSELGSSVKFLYEPMAYSGGKNLIYRNVEPIRQVFHVLGDRNNYPTFFHCRIGTDRTGAIAMLINALVGLSEKQIYQDYLFSNFGAIGKQPVIKNTDTPDDSVDGYVNAIKEFPGASLAEKTYNFLLSIGVPASDLDTIIDVLTEGDNKTADKGVVTVQKATEGTLSGAVAQVSTNFRSAPNYVAYGAAGDKVTFTVNTTTANQDLFAQMNCSVTNTTVKDALKVTIDNNEVNLPATSFATSVTGLGGDYWVPVKLASNLNLAAGAHTIVIESLGTAFNLEHIAVHNLAVA